MLALTIVALLLAAALALKVGLQVSDRFPSEKAGPGPWGLRSRLARPAEMTSAEKRWRAELEGSTDSPQPWGRVTDRIANLAEVLGVDPGDPPPTFSQRYLDERTTALEQTQGARNE